MSFEILDKEESSLPETLTYEQAMNLAAKLGPSSFNFPNQMLSFDELVKQQMQLKEQHQRQVLTERYDG